MGLLIKFRDLFTGKKEKNWNDLTPAEKRVRLAQDVIANLKLKIIVAEMGTYAKFDEEILEDLNPGDTDKQANKYLSAEKPCQVCAMGALFIADVMERNDLKVRVLAYGRTDSDAIAHRLDGVFEEHQLRLIETAFEKQVIDTEDEDLYDSYEGEDTPLAEDAISFGDHFPNAEQRLIAIMENIISNEGEFIP